MPGVVQQLTLNGMPDTDVIIPVLNEAESLPIFWSRLSSLDCFPRLRVTFIDNGSVDGTLNFLRGLTAIQLIEHGSDEGYGGSVLDGIGHTALPYIIIIDADCEYPPECIPGLLDALQDHNVVYASRLLGKPDHNAAGMPFLKMLGNRCVSTSFNGLFGQRCTDLYTGCKGIRRTALRNIRLDRKGFEHVLELAVSLSCRGYHIAEVPVDFSPRAGGVSKMSHVAETAKFLFWLLRYRWRMRHMMVKSS